MPFSYERAKRELQEEQTKLQEQLERLEATEYQSIGYSNHIADDATDAFEQAVGVALHRKVESTLEEVERVHIERVVQEAGGNLSRAARILDIDRTTLYSKLRRYGLKGRQTAPPSKQLT